jgi:hypothetical protein
MSMNEKRESSINYGTLVFGSFSLLSLVVCLVKGVVPIYAVEAAMWGGLAWYWHKKSPRSETATGIVLLLAVGVAAGEGYLLGRQSLGSNYTHLTRGSQYKASPETIPTGEALSIGLSNGIWENGISDTAGQICFDVRNGSHYVLQEITIGVSTMGEKGDFSFLDRPPELVRLRREFGGFLDVGKASRFCGAAPHPLPTGQKWTYSTEITMTGWK